MVHFHIMAKENSSSNSDLSRSSITLRGGSVHDVEKAAAPALDMDKSSTIIANDTIPELEQEYITGIRLYAVLFGITLVGFLIMLDQTIVVTVGHSKSESS
jgi:hypothetical protein